MFGRFAARPLKVRLSVPWFIHFAEIAIFLTIPTGECSMREHVRILGILNIVTGCLVALTGIGVFLVMGGIAGIVGMSVNTGDYSNGVIAAPIVAAISMNMAVFFLVIAAPSIIGGGS
jgi:disulfide bond formation protein DsbB